MNQTHGIMDQLPVQSRSLNKPPLSGSEGL